MDCIWEGWQAADMVETGMTMSCGDLRRDGRQEDRRSCIHMINRGGDKLFALR